MPEDMPKPGQNKTVAVVEDDQEIREIVLYALRSAGYAVSGFESGEQFLSELISAANLPSLVLLDIMLPHQDGLSVLARLRGSPQFKALPVILLTAKGSEYDRVKGLDLGADDYIVKPFSIIELQSRINAVLRRSRGSIEPDGLMFEGLLIDKARRLVSVGGKEVDLTYKEFELLHFLMLNTGLVMTRGQIMEAVWDHDFSGASRTLDMHIRSLRLKLGSAGAYIKTVRNVGYRIGL